MLTLHIAAHSPRTNLRYHVLKRGGSLPILKKVLEPYLPVSLFT